MNNAAAESAQGHTGPHPTAASIGAAPTLTESAPGEPPPVDVPSPHTRFVCPVCWQSDAGCRSNGEHIGCPHRQYRDAITTIERDGIVHHVYRVPPATAQLFFRALFEPTDIILFRLIETWTDTDSATGRTRKRNQNLWDFTTHKSAAEVVRSGDFWDDQACNAKWEMANQFFGTCPRFRAKRSVGSWDHACQIRVVRCLWADIDYCNVGEGLARCAAAGLPPATVVVNSGNGVHIYWRLLEPYLVDDVDDPLPIRWATVMQDGHPVRDRDGRTKRVPHFIDPQTGEHANGVFGASPKAEHIVSLLGMIAALVGGDHTTDLSRLLRVPETWNRKNQRNGQHPVQCALVECDASRRYPLAAFEALSTNNRTSQPEVPTDVLGGATRGARRPTPARADSAPPLPCLVAADPDDNALIARIRRSRAGSRFATLFDAGDLTALGNDPSRGDYALCNMLAFWTGSDPERIDRLFRRSRLYRPEKWDRPSYGERTIQKVLARRTTFWGQWPDENLPQIPLADLIDWEC